MQGSVSPDHLRRAYVRSARQKIYGKHSPAALSRLMLMTVGDGAAGRSSS